MVTLPPTLGLLRILPQTAQPSAATTVQPAAAGASAQTAGHGQAQNFHALPAGTQLTGTVTSQGQNGIYTLQLASGQALQVQANSQQQLPVGTTLTVETTASGQVRIVSLAVPAASQLQQLVGQFAGRWEKLDQVLAQLRQTNPTLAAKLEAVLPRPGGSFLPSLIAFALGLGQGNFEKLFGQNLITQLRNAGIDLDADAPLLHQISKQSDGESPWKALFFPYQEDADSPPHQGSLFWRRNNDGEEESTRFVVNLSLRAYGAVQIDGLLHKPTLFTKVRLAKPPQATNFEEGLQTTYTAALAALALDGDIKVEVTDKFNVDPLHDILKPNPNVRVTV